MTWFVGKPVGRPAPQPQPQVQTRGIIASMNGLKVGVVSPNYDAALARTAAKQPKPVNFKQTVPPGGKGHVKPPGSPPTQARTITRGQVIASVGHKPKAAPWHSQRYKSVLNQIDQYHGALAKARVPSDANSRQALVTDLSAKLDAVDTAAASYLQKHPNSAAMQKVRTDIAAEKQLLQDTLQSAKFADPKLNEGAGFTLQQAMELQRYGIEPTADVTFDELHTDALAKKSNEAFGSGAANTVALVKYQDGEKRVLKPEPTARAKLNVDENGQIDEHRPHYGNRNIATARLAEILNTDIVPKTKYAIHNDRLYTSMELAKGVNGNGEKGFVEVPKGSQLYKLVEAEVAKLNDPNSKNYNWHSLQQFMTENDLRLEMDANDNVAGVHKYSTVPYDVNYRQPELAKSLNNLEWLDFITGQADRHPGNFFMEFDKNGNFLTVKAIDQDSSFGKATDPVALAGSSQALAGYNGIGLPLVIDNATMRQLLDPKTWPKMEAALKNLLTPAEVDAAKLRYDAAVKAINDMPADRIIHDWSSQKIADIDAQTKKPVQRSPIEFLIAHPDQSYLGRNQAVLERRRADGIQPLDLPS